MADDQNSPPVVKQSPTVATATRTGLVGGTVLAAIPLGDVVQSISGIIHDIWPNVRELSEAASLNWAICLTAGASALLSWLVRGNVAANRRATD